ncbi:MAG: alpha/beta hydrolase-fold protein, partial [Bacteroidota bacterium]
ALLVTILLGLVPRANAQEFGSFEAFVDSLDAIGAIADASVRAAATDALWDDLRAAEAIPFTSGEDVAFLWRGSASRVVVNGDFNAWGNAGWIANSLVRVGQSDVWRLVTSFPADARLDYKLVLNGSNWILDPENPHQQWGGFGPNSELRMPAWTLPGETIPDAAVPAGALTADVRIESDALGEAVNYRVYTPAGYADLAALPTVYVTDGHEYRDDRLGAMQTALDHLIADGVVAPLIAVFIDPRDPATGANRRAEHYIENPDFADFVADELVPAIDAAYRTDARPERRAILGTSLGGVCATYFGVERPDTFGNLAIQSPAYWVAPDLFTRYATAPPSGLRVALTVGTFFDGGDAARDMRNLFADAGYDLAYLEVNEGHSWGAWRAQHDVILGHLFPGVIFPSNEDGGAPRHLVLDAFPNPSAAATTLRFTLGAPSPATLVVYDLLGREVARLRDGTLGAGVHTAQVGMLPPGVYVVRLATPDGTTTQRFVQTR